MQRKAHEYGTLLYDVKADPHQEHPITGDPQAEQKMIRHLLQLMKDNDAPVEQYERLGLESAAG
jgi:hypothetical protein